jgi:hypothetical protein
MLAQHASSTPMASARGERLDVDRHSMVRTTLRTRRYVGECIDTRRHVAR